MVLTFQPLAPDPRDLFGTLLLQHIAGSYVLFAFVSAGNLGFFFMFIFDGQQSV